MRDEIVLAKAASIERCLRRVRQETEAGLSRLDDQTVQDAVVLNIQRACEQAIDLAMHVVATRRLGVPQESREAFELLRRDGVIDDELAEQLQRMVGFRNVAIHEYQRLDRGILDAIVTTRLGDFEAFIAAVVRA